jgi:hypothetical protein
MKLKVEHFDAYDLVSICFDYQAKCYAQDTRNQYSILGRLICLPDCDKTSEKRKRKSVVFGINVYLNKFNIKF